MAVRLIITGGTIDKDYVEKDGSVWFGKDTHFEEIIAEARLTVPLEISRVMLKDSLDMTDADRLQVVHALSTTPEERAIVAHGTDTMTETGQAIDAADLGKVVVMFGAMRPWALGRSDAQFNFGSALTAVQLLEEPGVYVAMNGNIHPIGNVRKNVDIGRFEAIE